MAGLVPAIHVFGSTGKKDVDARDKPGHDDGEYLSNILRPLLYRRNDAAIDAVKRAIEEKV